MVFNHDIDKVPTHNYSMERQTFRRLLSISAWILLIASWFTNFTIYGIQPFWIALAIWILGGTITNMIYGRPEPKNTSQGQQGQFQYGFQQEAQQGQQNQFQQKRRQPAHRIDQSQPDSQFKKSHNSDLLPSCPSCGTFGLKGDKFCQDCGTTLTQPTMS